MAVPAYRAPHAPTRPATRPAAGWASAALLVGVFPANVQMSLDRGRRAQRKRTPQAVGVFAGTDVAAIKSAIAELEQSAQAMAKHVYEKGQGGPGAAGGPTPPPGGGGGKGGDDVIDAEFEVKK